MYWIETSSTSLVALDCVSPGVTASVFVVSEVLPDVYFHSPVW